MRVGRCPTLAIATVFAWGVVRVSAEDHPLNERLRTGRDRLTELAKQESLARPEDANALLRWMFLRGSMEIPETTDLPVGAALAQVACESAFDDLSRGASPGDVASLAEERVAELDRQLPGSSLVPLYRLRLLILTCRQRPDFYVAARQEIEEALKRNDFDSPVVPWMLAYLDWRDRNEPDPFVRVMLFPTNLSRPWLAYRPLQKILSGASMSPGTPAPDLVALASAFHGLLAQRARTTTDCQEVVVAHVMLRRNIEARALLAWRLGDQDGLQAASEEMDDWIHHEKREDAWSEALLKEQEDEVWLLQQTMERALHPLNDPERLKEVAEGGTAEIEKAIRDAAVGRSGDTQLLEEWYERVEGSAVDILRRRREELTRTLPWREEIRSYAPKERDLTNGLARLIGEEAILRSGVFPEERVEELLDLALDPNSRVDAWKDVEGWDVESWAILDALHRAKEIPVARVLARLETRCPRRAEILALLYARGQDVKIEEVDRALEEARSTGFWTEMHGFCRILAARVQDQPEAALSLVPAPQGEAPEYVEAMIAETLSNATGQPFGLDLARWREWLKSRD